MNRKSKLALSVLAAISAASVSTVSAIAAQPTYGTAIIDGNQNEWNLTNDFFSKMCEAGAVDQTTGECNNKDHLSSLYMRYDCNTNTIFALVLRESNFWPEKSKGEAWIKIYELGNSPVVDGDDDNNGSPSGNPPEFSWVPPDGVEGVDLTGYEASFILQPGSYNMEAHVNIVPDRTSSTGKSGNRSQISVQCDNTPPPSPSIDIETYTNDIDADNPTGPVLTVGDSVTWTYWVTNDGNIPLTNVTVTDNQLSPNLICTIANIAVDDVVQCTASGSATAGQYANVGTATGYDSNNNSVSDTDPSHYFGEEGTTPQPAIDIETSTNGVDADDPTGPTILVYATVTWDYVVTNIGNVDLQNIVVTDNRLGPITCPFSSLMVGGSMTCTATGTATAETAEQYANNGSVTGVDADNTGVTDNDNSHYFRADPSLDIETWTQGFDADDPTGPFIEITDTVYWLYSVTNTGNVVLTNIAVTDNNLSSTNINCGGDDNDNVIDSLLVGDTMNCTANGAAAVGQYANTGIADTTYTDDFNNQAIVYDIDDSHYFGVQPGIDIEKATNGEDADSAPGVPLIEGDLVTWTYSVTNTGNVALDNVVVTDDNGTPADTSDDFNPTFTGGDTNNDGKLDIDEIWTYESTGFAILYQYGNEAEVTGDYTVITGPDGTPETRTAEDMDPSYYYGVISNQPSLSVFGMNFDITGDTNEFVNGSFIIQNASGGPEVQAIFVPTIDMTIEYRKAGGGKWNLVPETCTYAPIVPFVFEGPTGTLQKVNFYCTAITTQIPADATTVRVTAEVNIFNRGKTFNYRKSNEPQSGNDGEESEPNDTEGSNKGKKGR
jgi:uncharacterized repeat protein (TIGR01451 family)